jgi:[acyl-carrier-protein] S-malonyltransferase
MLAGLHCADESWQQLCDLLGSNPLCQSDPHWFCKNEVASLLTVYFSMKTLQEKQEQADHISHVAGYSVGQLSALWTCGCIKTEELLPTVQRRAQIMNAHCAEGSPSAMLAVIGLTALTVQGLIAELGLNTTTISNINAPGQLTLAGSKAELERLEPALKQHKPRKLQPLGTSGAWHSPWLKGAEAEVCDLFRSKLIRPPATSPQLICNTNAEALDLNDSEAVARVMGKQVQQPVLWEASVRRLIREGCEPLIECGHGSVLSKFGFFIDRSVHHLNWELTR